MEKDLKKAYFNDVKGLLKEKLDIIEMKMGNCIEISEFDIELMELALEKLKYGYNEYIQEKALNNVISDAIPR